MKQAEIRTKIEELKSAYQDFLKKSDFNFDQKNSRKREIEKMMTQEGFWQNNRKAKALAEELNKLEEQL
ncbi:MAG: hypothetical protein GF347_02785 [Candidatus Moranbacteria bacterium]|nr:hypothetical protein [Candidatus Moranbacteria bacterium]